MRGNALSRLIQKQKIKRQYAKQAREAAKQGAKAAEKTAVTTEKLVARAVGFVKRHPVGALLFVAVFLLLVMMQSCMSSLATLGNGTAGAIGASTYPAEDADLLGAEAAYCALEAELQNYLDTYESTHDYDEYHYDLDEIEHDPYFFSVVDEADLLAALEASGTELPECTCAEKCVAGAINMDCPVCSTNMTECVGGSPSPNPWRSQSLPPNRSPNRRVETPGRSCSFWRWRWWAAEPGGISRSTAPSSSGPLKPRRTTGTSWKPTTIPRRGTRRKRTKRRATNEIHQQSL